MDEYFQKGEMPRYPEMMAAFELENAEAVALQVISHYTNRMQACMAQVSCL